MNKQEWTDLLGEQLLVENFYLATKNVTKEDLNWGSIQYEPTAKVYHTFFLMRKDLSLEDTLDVFGIKLSDKKFRRIKTIIEENNKNHIIEDLFILTRKTNWDLWVATECIVNNFITDEIEFYPDGCYSFKTGILCALLVEFKIVTDQTVFHGFDT